MDWRFFLVCVCVCVHVHVCVCVCVWLCVFLCVSAQGHLRCSTIIADAHLGKVPLDKATDILLRDGLMEVLNEGRRAHFADITRSGNTFTVTSPAGRYRSSLVKDSESGYPREGMPEIRIVRGKAYCDLAFPISSFHQDFTRVKGLIRSAFGASIFPAGT